MRCVDTLMQKEFRWLLFYLRDSSESSHNVRAIPRDVITDRNLLQGYLQMLVDEGYLKAFITGISGKLEIESVFVRATIHALARQAEDYEAAEEGGRLER